MWCTFNTDNKESILIGNIYHSPNSCKENTDKLYKLLESSVFNKFDRTIITGDFNFREIRWNGEWSGESNNKFIEALRNGYFTQHVNKPTRYRLGQQSNILDLVLSRNDDDILNIDYCSPIGKSDHILLKITTNIMKVRAKVIDSTKFDWNRGNYNKLREHIKNCATEWDSIKNHKTTKECWDYIKENIKEGTEQNIPKTKLNTNKS